eukprot:scaffold6701_cov188-Prasinococcus_capsulatus_cf.AAC.1
MPPLAVSHSRTPLGRSKAPLQSPEMRRCYAGASGGEGLSSSSTRLSWLRGPLPAPRCVALRGAEVARGRRQDALGWLAARRKQAGE